MVKHQSRFLLVFSFLITLTLILTNCGSALNSSSDSTGSSDSDSGDSDDGTTGGDSISETTINGISGTLTTSDGSPLAGATVILSNPSTSSFIKAAITDDYGRTLNLGKVTDDDGDACANIGVTGTIYSLDCTDSTGTYIFGEIPCDTTLKLTAVKKSFSFSIDVTLSCSSLTFDGESGSSDILVSLGNFTFDDNCGASDDGGENDCTVICHVPPGNPDNEHTICISPNAVDAHINHGDYLGECNAGSGTSISTLVNAKSAYTIDSDSCDFDIANMAVVTGHYDDIQNVLAKLGYGSVTSYGVLDDSKPFDFTLIDGNNSLDDSLYDNFEDFVIDVDNLTPYDIIFINCGNSTERLSTDSTVMANLQEYVENGGKLYVTDWSYMFLEQAFSSFMNFFSGGDDADTAETPIYAAKVGRGGITSDATVNDDTMANWLDNVYVNSGEVKYYCYSLPDEDVNATLGARNFDDTVTIGDFLGGWVMMKEAHTDILTEPKIWISGPVVSYYGYYENDDAPLTVSRDEGSGRILYSSYHTAHSCPTTGFWPQERILQYLVFEL